MEMGFTRKPPLASGAYAVAMSSGVTSPAPRPMEGTTGRSSLIPMRLAMFTTRSGPSSRVIWMYTELSERSVAL